MEDKEYYSTQYQELLNEEHELSFQHFSNEDAFSLAEIIMEKAKSHSEPLGIEITLNGLLVFRYYPTGITRDHQMWLKRKYNTVLLRDSSTMRLTAFYNMNHATLRDWKLNPDDYCLGGGGYPIRILNSGVIGAVCVSGYPDAEDHRIIVDAIREFIRKQRII